MGRTRSALRGAFVLGISLTQFGFILLFGSLAIEKTGDETWTAPRCALLALSLSVLLAMWLRSWRSGKLRHGAWITGLVLILVGTLTDLSPYLALETQKALDSMESEPAPPDGG